MGIYREIRPYLKAHAATKKAWVGASGVVVSPDQRGAVEIVDVLTEMHPLVNKNKDRAGTRQFTGEEFYQIVRKWIVNAHVEVYVICMDYQPRVPHRKHAEQKRRAESRAVAAGAAERRANYRSGARFTDAGIEEPIVVLDPGTPAPRRETSTQVVDDDAKEARGATRRFRAAEPFDLDVVLGQRNLRSALIGYVARRMAKDQALYGVSIIFDYNNRVELLQLEHTDATSGRWALRPIVTKLFQHGYGESDKKMLFWLRVFHHRPCWVRSVDGDMLPLLLQYLTSTEPARPTDAPVHWIYSSWRRGSKSTGGMINMGDLMSRLHTQLKWNTEEFVVACILCGTDYFEKNTLFRGVGYLYLLYAVQQSRKQVRVLWDYAIRHAFDDTVIDGDDEQKTAIARQDDTKEKAAAQGAFEVIVRRVYDLRILHRNLVALKSDMDALAADKRDDENEPRTLESLQELVQKKWKSMKVPSRDEVDQQLHLVAWHIHYWCLAELNRKVPRLDLMERLLHP